LTVDVPEDLRYTEDHEWLRIEGSEGTVGVTAYAADQLGDVVFVELPAAGTKLTARQSFGVVESVKAVSDLYAPLAGEVVEANEALSSRPELVNSDPYGAGWMLRLRLDDPAEAEKLHDSDAYRSLTEAG
jgi:glycine cleavage system H protein